MGIALQQAGAETIALVTGDVEAGPAVAGTHDAGPRAEDDLVQEVYVPLDPSADYTPQLSQLVSANPDGIAVFGSSDINVRVISGLRSAGYTGLIGSSWNRPDARRDRDPRRRRRGRHPGERLRGCDRYRRARSNSSTQRWTPSAPDAARTELAINAWASVHLFADVLGDLDTIDTASIVAALDNRPVDLGVAPPFTLGVADNQLGLPRVFRVTFQVQEIRDGEIVPSGDGDVPRRQRLRHRLSPLNELLRFVLLGLGVGAVYALTGQGLVLIYRGSGVVNFAQGAFAMIGAFLYYRATGDRNWSPALAWLVALGVPALLGVLTHVLVMSRLRYASSLVRVVATLAVFFLALAVANQVWGEQGTPVRSPLPVSPREFLGAGNGIPEDRLWLIAIAVIVTAVLWALFKWTRFGHSTDAAAENPIAAAALGFSPDRIAMVNWALGGALAAAGGVLIAPILFLSVPALAFTVLRGLAGRARRIVPLVLVDARRGVRYRRRRVDPQPLHREQGRVRPVGRRRRAPARQVHIGIGVPVLRVPPHRRRHGRSAADPCRCAAHCSTDSLRWATDGCT